MPQPKLSIVHRRAHLAVLLTVVAAIAGCGGAEPASPSAVPGSTAAAAPASPLPGRVDLGDAPAYVALAATDVTVRAQPGDGGGVLAVFPAKLPWGSPMSFLVRQAQRDATGVTWLNVSLPRRPNGSSGWIRRDQVRLRPVAHEVVVDLSSRTAQLLRDGRTERSWPVGIGRDNTPTPTGRFYITVKLRPRRSRVSTAPGRWGSPATRTCSSSSAPVTVSSPSTVPMTSATLDRRYPTAVSVWPTRPSPRLPTRCRSAPQ
jgi:L,D-transpeptidase catalytic domain